MEGVVSALLLTLIAGSATGIGGALVLFKKKLSSISSQVHSDLVQE